MIRVAEWSVAGRPGWFASRFMVLFIVLLATGISASYAATSPVPEDTADARAQFERLVQQGKEFLQQRDFEAAQSAFTNALEIFPDHPEALYQMGVTLISSGRFREGVEFIERSVALVPDNLSLRLILADVYEKGGLLEQAVRELEQVMDRADDGPQRREAEIRLALLQSRQLVNEGRNDQALDLLSSTIEKYPDDTRLLNHQGIALLATGQLDAAEQVFTRLIELAPRDAAAHLNIALVYGGQGRMDRAVPHLEEVIEIAPDSAAAEKAIVRLGLFRGQQALEGGDPERALEEFRKVIAVEPGNVFAGLSIATILHQAGRIEEAESIYRQIIEAVPNNFDARLRLGRLYSETNRFPEAVQEFKYIVEHGGDRPIVEQARTVLVGLLVAIGNTLVGEGEINEAADIYREVTRYDPENPEGYRRLGLLLQSQRQLEDARHQFEAMIQIDDTNAEAHFLLGRTLDLMNDLDAAVREYAKALALEQNAEQKEEIIIAMGLARSRSLLAQDKLEEGKEELLKLVERAPGNPVPLFFLALVHTQQGNVDEAVSVYERLIEIQPGHVRARLNLALLYERLNRDEDAIDEYRLLVGRATDEDIVERARARLALVEQRVRGTTYSMNYAMGYDGNSNLSNLAPTEELRTDLSFSLGYHFKTRNNIRYRFVLSPSYAMFHKGNFDFLTTSFSTFATVLRRDKTFGAGYTHQTRLSLLNEQRGSSSNSISLEGGWNLDRQELRGRASLSTQNSETASVFDSTTLVVGGSLDRLVGDRNSIGISYDFVDNDNSINLGNDYAYDEHSWTVRLDRRIAGSLTGYVRYILSLRDYKNPDSFSGFTRTRENTFHSVRVGFNHRYTDDLSFYGSYTYSVNDSNLPVGVILDSQDLQEIVGLQSSSLGDYERAFVALGMSLRF